MEHELYDILSAAVGNVQAAVPHFKKAVYLAKIDEQGRILKQVYPTQSEYKWAGIADNEGDYFYIRHRDGGEIYFEDPADTKRFYCSHRRQLNRYELRLVAVMREVSGIELETKVRSALIKTILADMGAIKKIEFVPRKSIIDTMAVFKEESPTTKPFDKSLTFVAIDFDLTFEMNYF